VSKGKPLSTQQLVNRAVKTDIARTVYQFRRYVNDGNNVNNFSQPVGHYNFSGKRYLPLLMFDLTRCVQSSLPLTGPGARASFAKHCYMDIAGTDEGLIKWEDITGQTADGSTTNPFAFVAESKALASRTVTPIRKSILSWVSIKLNLMGARTRPGWFKVQIVTFKDDEHLDPWTVVGPGQHNTFWTEQVSKLTCNSIHDLPKRTSQRMKVLMEKTFSWQPTSTTESDPRAHVDTLNMFYRPNKTCNYHDGGNIPKLATDESIAVTNNQSASQGDGISEFSSNGKIYLLITAFNPYHGAAFDPNIHPSCEFNIKTSHLSLDT